MQHIEILLNGLEDTEYNIKSIYLKGSRLDQSTVDFWSDIDTLVVLENSIINTDILTILDDIFKPILGKETYVFDGGVTYRVITKLNGLVTQYDIPILSATYWKQHYDDLSINIRCIYGIDESKGMKELEIDKPTYEYNVDQVNQVWFLYYQCVKKFARNDNLIGMHLLFDLLREYLVLEMIERDLQEGTTIHRFGKSEKYPDVLDMTLLEGDDFTNRMEFLKALGKIYDDKLLTISEQYESNYKYFKSYVDKSIIKKL